MSEKLRTIRLYGSLGRKFGRVHRLAVSSVQEAIRALRVVCPGFEQELMTSKDRGIGYGIWVGKENLKDTKQFRYPVGNDDIRIAPVLMGAKRGGLLQIFVGIVIVIAAVWTGGAAAGAAGAAGGAAGAGIFRSFWWIRCCGANGGCACYGWIGSILIPCCEG